MVHGCFQNIGYQSIPDFEDHNAFRVQGLLSKHTFYMHLYAL
jgi:hypothetical protein